MFLESDLLPLSALQHLLFCERQCALIHIEQVWLENRLTLEGRLLHKRVHEQQAESRKGVYIVRGLKLRSLELGLVGVADVVEFYLVQSESEGVRLDSKKGFWQPCPVEYKRGAPKSIKCDEIQLCGQAICLEEMLNCSIPKGILYYGRQHRRYEVVFSNELRKLTESAAARLHELIQKGITPTAYYAKRCESCSLLDICVPKLSRHKEVEKYIKEVLG